MTEKKTFMENYHAFSKLADHVSVGATRSTTDFVGVAKGLSGEGASGSVDAFLEHLRETGGEPTEGQATETPKGKAR